ncbi:MAG: hypothetical protein K2Y14_13870 [Burkholderiales bacterium]|nr:hypothetical protein [Burkholderiales bacterium]
MTDQFQPMNLPYGYTAETKAQPEVMAPASEVRKPSFGLSMAATAYGVLADGPTATVGTYIDTKLGMPTWDNTHGLATPSRVSYMQQDKTDQLWIEAGIPDKAPDATKYNSVAIYYLLDKAKRRQAMRDINDATEYSAVGTTSRAVASLGLGMLDPINLATGFFPAAKLFSAVGMKGAAAGVTALSAKGGMSKAGAIAAGITAEEAAAAVAPSLAGRVAARTAAGAIEGAVGNVPLEAVTAPMRSSMGEDYTAADSMYNLAFGAALGGGIHVVTGGMGHHVTPELLAQEKQANSPVEKFKVGLTEEQRAQYVNPENGLTHEGVKELKHQTLKEIYGDTPALERLAQSSNPEIYRLSSNLIEASTQINPAKVEVSNLSIKGDLIEALDNIANKHEPRQEPNLIQSETVASTQEEPVFKPEVEKLTNFIDQNTTSPRMIAEVVNNYNQAVENLAAHELPLANKSELLEQAMQGVEPSAKELAELATHGTKESVLKAASMQMVDGKTPTVNAMLKSDENIGRANLDDIKQELRRADDPQNSYITSDLPKRSEIETPLPFANEIDYAKEIPKLNDQIKQIEELSKMGLYSRKAKGEKFNQPESREAKFSRTLEKYKKQVDDFFAGKFKTSDKLELGEVPDVYQMVGLSAKDVVMREKNVRKISGGEDVYHGHGLTEEQIKQIPEQLANPVMIFKSTSKQNPNGIVVLTELKGKDGFPIIATLNPDKTVHNLEVHEFTSAYGKDPLEYGNKNWFILHHEKDKILYRNKEKVDNLRRDPALSGAQDAEINDLINSASISDENGLVKYVAEKNQAEQAKLNSKTVLTEAIAKSFGTDTEKLLATGKIEVVSSVKDLPGGEHPNDVKAMTYKDKAYFVADNLSPEAARNVVLHEVGVHSNMREYLGGDKQFNDLIKQLNNVLEQHDDLGRIVDAAVPADTPAKFRNEERLAYMIENLPEVPFVQQVIAKVRAWMYKTFPSIGKHMQLTDNDIGALAVASLRNYAKRDSISIGGHDFKYSRDAEVVEGAKVELDALNDAIERTAKIRERLLRDPYSLVDIADANTFHDYVNQNLMNMNKEDAKELYTDIGRAYYRYREMSTPNPEVAAINYALDKWEYGQLAHKVAVTHDKALITKRIAYLKKNWAGREKDGINTLLVGSTRQREGSRAFTLGSELVNSERLHLGNFMADLKGAELEDAFLKGVFNDDIMRAMELLEAGKKTDHLAPEAVKLAQIIQKSYDGITNDLRRNGLVVNKVKNYFANQQYMHNEMLIKAAGFEKWRDVVRKTLDYEATAEALNMKPSDINDEFLQGVFNHLSGAKHIAKDGNLGAKVFTGNSLRAVKNQQRKLHFKDADAVIEYRNEFGNRDFQSSVIGTMKANTRKLALTKTLGVNYERNLKEIAEDFRKSSPVLETRKKLSSWIDKNMLDQLKSMDGRADRPVNELGARVCSNIRAIKSMASLGMATISAISDVVNAAAFLNQKGMGRGVVVDSIAGLAKAFKGFSAEHKQFIAANGVFAESVLSNAYRFGEADNSVGKWLAKSQHIFFNMTGLDQWTNSTRLNAMDSLMYHMASYADKEHSQLSKSLQRSLGMFNIGELDWNLIRQSNLKQLDGRNYLGTSEFESLRPKIEAEYAQQGISGDLLKAATDKRLEQLKRNMYNFYMDGMASMIIEPNAATKYYGTWGGQAPGTVIGELARFAMQFKSFSVGFMRNTLFDKLYERHDSFWGKNGYLMDTSAEGKLQKMHMAKFIAGLTVAGYMAGMIKDLLKGKEPRPIFKDDGWPNGETLTAAFLQGGGAGIYGDFMFGDYNRFGGGLADTLMGPVGGQVGQLAAIGAALRPALIGDDTPDVGAKVARLAIGNTPFVNTFYTSAAFNYLFAYSLQEKLNPGYLNRMERNMKKNNDQEFMFPPSEYAPQW